MERLLIRRDPATSAASMFSIQAKRVYRSPYRDLSRLRSVSGTPARLRHLRGRRSKEIDEASLFEAVAEMRPLRRPRDLDAVSPPEPDTASSWHPSHADFADASPRRCTASISPDEVLQPFDEIEGW